jgi:dTDP-4-amino-4,6-dideoxygalactose transaminase
VPRINVTKTFLPPLDEYEAYLRQIWERGILTNQGPLLLEFESKIRQRFGVRNFHLVSNGTLALQIALRALDIGEGEVITTPFTYVATTSAILWERCDPVYVDIDPETLCIDTDKIEAAITPRTKAIMPVHVFGRACDIDAIDAIAKKHSLRVVYDAAHAFGVTYGGKSLFEYGDISTASFHATKLFHSVEGGGIFVRDAGVSERVELMKRFGHTGDEHSMLGINAKTSELHAAMGLCNLNHIDEITDGRRRVVELYDQLLSAGAVQILAAQDGVGRNYAYYPILLRDEAHLMACMDALSKVDVYPRRYFYPSLNNLPYVTTHYECPTSEDIANRIMCLPLYDSLEDKIVRKICEVINS